MKWSPAVGRGHGPGLGLAGVGGLVTLAVSLRVRALDVGRQGQVAHGLEVRGQVPFPLKVHLPAAEVPGLHGLEAEVVAEGDDRARLGRLGGAQQPLGPGRGPARFGQGLGHEQGQRGQQQELHAPARGLHAEDAGRDHARVVGHEQRVFRQMVRQRGEVGQLAGGLLTVEHQQARAVAAVGGLLGNALLGQVVVVAFEPVVLGYFHTIYGPPWGTRFLPHGHIESNFFLYQVFQPDTFSVVQIGLCA